MACVERKNERSNETQRGERNKNGSSRVKEEKKKKFGKRREAEVKSDGRNGGME